MVKVAGQNAEFLRFCEIYDKIVAGWDFEVQSRYVSTEFGRTHTLMAGDADAPPLVLLHGGNSTSIMWEEFFRKLASNFRVIAVDLIWDYGKTCYQKPVKKVEDYLKWLEDLLKAIGIKKAYFAGFSYGGWVLINLCLHRPERVLKATFYAPAGGLTPLSLKFMMQAAWTFVFPQKKVIKEFFLSASHQNLHSDPDYIKEVDELVELVEAGRKLKASFLPPRVFTDQELSSLETPIQIFIGEHEVIYNAHKAIDRAKKCIKSAESFLLINASHDLVYTYKDYLCKQIADFCQ